jgi:hypothetical protein
MNTPTTPTAWDSITLHIRTQRDEAAALGDTELVRQLDAILIGVES